MLKSNISGGGRTNKALLNALDLRVHQAQEDWKYFVPKERGGIQPSGNYSYLPLRARAGTVLGAKRELRDTDDEHVVFRGFTDTTGSKFYGQRWPEEYREGRGEREYFTIDYEVSPTL